LNRLLKVINPEDIIYLDECGIDERIKREYEYALKGKRLNDEKSGNRFNKRITIISALKMRRKFLSAIYFRGSRDTVVFNTWIQDYLLPLINNQRKVIIMDNASFHKSEEARRLIETAGHTLLYLPPYSPDFNPIEGKWTHLKSFIKTAKDKFDNFYDCLDYCLNTMS
jgi:hypothetical protein